MISLFRNLTVIALTALQFSRLASTREIPKRHLIVSSIRQPLVNDPELSTLSVGIVEYMVLETLSQHLNFTYEVRPPTDILTSGYIQQNGSWTGTTGQLQREEVDLCVTTTALTTTKQFVISFSQPVIFVDAAIIIPFPREKIKIWLDEWIFLPSAWIASGVSFAILILASCLINRITPRMSSNQQGLGYWIIYYISVWCSQGLPMRNSSFHLRIVCATAFLGIYILSNYFTANYTSLLSIPMFKTSVNSIEELAKSDTVKTLIAKGSNTEDYIMTSAKNDPIYKKIAQQMRRYPDQRISNLYTIEDISAIVKDGYALLVMKSNGEALVQKSYQLNRKHCRVTLAEKYFFSRPQSFTYPKSSSIATIFDMQILRMHQSGLIQYAERRAAAPINQCYVTEIKKASETKAIPLAQKDLVGAFLFYVLGIGLGILIMTFELIISKLLK